MIKTIKTGEIFMITFSDIAPSDAKSLAELDKECFSVPWSEKSFSNEAENQSAIYVIAKKDNTIVGYAGLWQVLDEGQITNIAVKKDFRRKKIASSMICELIKRAIQNNISRLTLEVRKSNTAAIALYTSCGFQPVGERKNYYHSPTENAVLMDLNISKNLSDFCERTEYNG